VDDITRRQAVARGDLGVAGGAAAQRSTFRQQTRPGRAVNRTVHTAAAQQRFIGRVDDGIHLHLRNVAFDDLDFSRAPHHSPPALSTTQAYAPRTPLKNNLSRRPLTSGLRSPISDF
jgi:hypothetical protein